jgi:hypothetical protein
VLEDSDLSVPVPAEFRAPVESDLAYVAGLVQQFVKERQIALPLVGDLGMETEGCSDAGGITG